MKPRTLLNAKTQVTNANSQPPNTFSAPGKKSNSKSISKIKLRHNMRKLKVHHEKTEQKNEATTEVKMKQQGQSYLVKTTLEASRDMDSLVLFIYLFFVRFSLKMNSFSTVTPKTHLH